MVAGYAGLINQSEIPDISQSASDGDGGSRGIDTSLMQDDDQKAAQYDRTKRLDKMAQRANASDLQQAYQSKIQGLRNYALSQIKQLQADPTAFQGDSVTPTVAAKIAQLNQQANSYNSELKQAQGTNWDPQLNPGFAGYSRYKFNSQVAPQIPDITQQQANLDALQDRSRPGFEPNMAREMQQADLSNTQQMPQTEENIAKTLTQPALDKQHNTSVALGIKQEQADTAKAAQQSMAQLRTITGKEAAAKTALALSQLHFAPKQQAATLAYLNAKAAQASAGAKRAAAAAGLSKVEAAAKAQAAAAASVSQTLKDLETKARTNLLNAEMNKVKTGVQPVAPTGLGGPTGMVMPTQQLQQHALALHQNDVPKAAQWLAALGHTHDAAGNPLEQLAGAQNV